MWDDLIKAFDALPHGLMIAKLIGSYLSSRQQRVKVGGDKGEWQYLKCWAPQGSVLGPLLFNIFQNDFLFFFVNLCILYIYADDNTLSKIAKDVKMLKYKLSIASETAFKWFKDNVMKANAPKFQVACFSRDKEIEGITINLECFQLHSNEYRKLLGVHVDRYFTFNHHLSELCRKATRQVNCLMQLSTMLSVQSKLTIFNACNCL